MSIELRVFAEVSLAVVKHCAVIIPQGSQVAIDIADGIEMLAVGNKIKARSIGNWVGIHKLRAFIVTAGDVIKVHADVRSSSK